MTQTRNVPPPGGGGRRPTAAITVVGLIGLTGSLMLNAALDRGEGNRLIPYLDSARIATVCRGVIRVGNKGKAIELDRRYTRDECASLNEAETVAHLQAAMDAVPALKEGCPTNCRRLNQIVAGASLTYNIGPRAFRNSTVARRWNAGDWHGGCDAFAMWTRAGGRHIRGLALRRAWEQRDYCFVGLPPRAGRRP